MKWDTLIKVYLGLENRGYYAMLRRRTEQILEVTGKKLNHDLGDCVCAVILALLIVRADIKPPANIGQCYEKLGITSIEELALKVGKYTTKRGRKPKSSKPHIVAFPGVGKPGGSS